MRVAHLGAGQLGGPICDAIAAAGHDVTVYDPYEPAWRARVAAGARAATSPAEAANGAEVVIVFVRDDEQAHAAVLGDRGALQAAVTPAAMVLHSTVSAETVRTLHAACQQRGVQFIDVGVSRGNGREPNAVYAMCGGPEATIEFVRPVLASYCADIVRFGDVGAGMAAKLLRNAIQYTKWVALYEGLVAAERAGLDLAAMAHLYKGTFGVSSDDAVVLGRTTMRALPLEEAKADPNKLAFLNNVISLAWKDLDDALALAGELGVSMPMGAIARREFGPALGLAVSPD